MRKKIALSFMSLVLAAGLCPTAAFAETEIFSARFADGVVAQSADSHNGTCGGCNWSIDDSGHLSIAPMSGVEADAAHAEAGVLNNSDFYSTGIDACWEWLSYCEDIKTVSFGEGVRCDGGSRMFANCSNLISVDLSNLDVSRATDLSGMFVRCSSLTSLDLSVLNTSNVMYMDGMFQGCASLISINLKGFDTSSAMNMAGLFSGCFSLTSLDLSSFDTSNVYSMHNMFSLCYKLTTLDLSNFDTSNVVMMGNMFDSCRSLVSLNLSSFDTSNLNDDGYLCFDNYPDEFPLQKLVLGPKTKLHKYCGLLLEASWRLGSASKVYTSDQLIAKSGTTAGAGTWTRVAATTSLAKASVSGIATKTYAGKALTQKPTVKLGGKTLKSGTDYTLTYKNNKNVGAATVTVTGKGSYSGSVSKTFAINPKGATIAAPKAASKALTAKWKAQTAKMATSAVTGYQVQYATNSKFTSAKTVTVKGYKATSKKVTKLAAKKKYWVRVRTYKTVSKVNYYSSWSAAKTVTTKK